MDRSATGRKRRRMPTEQSWATEPFALHVATIGVEVLEPHPVFAWWSRGFACMKSPWVLRNARIHAESRSSHGWARDSSS